jgi:peptidoglycan/LPS O-acetylase OafA/YrhL
VQPVNNSKQDTKDYRREIDGLRALAVLSVVLFHAGFETFSGGFVGVDVFFVISGYLITTIILAELEQGKFSIVNFYERRARRILPALFLVMFVCMPFAWFWLLPSEMKDFSQSLVAVSVFASNMLFWYESGYFDASAELKPLLHTWSLAVEEQYYVLFPLFLMLFWRLGKRLILITLGLVFVASFAVAEWAAYAKPAAAFYLLPTRGWELLIGAFAALYMSRANRKEFSKAFGEICGWLGVALFLYSCFSYSKVTPFPGLYALVPTLGTVLIILFATQKTTVGKFVGNKAFVGVGLISYSAYLWHQPLFAFARQRSTVEPSYTVFLVLSVIAFVLAYFSWRFVEAPFRRKKIPRFKVFLFAGVGSILMIAIGLYGNYKDGFISRLPPNIVWESLGSKLEAKGDICIPIEVADFPGVLTCEFGDKRATKSVILYGDSHAQAISEYLDIKLTEKSIKGIKVALDGCGIVPTIIGSKESLKAKNDCGRKFLNLISFLKVKDSNIIMTSRWSFRLYPVEGLIENMPYKNSEGGFEKERYQEYAVLRDGNLKFDKHSKTAAVIELVEGLLSTNLRLFLIYPVPEIGWDISRLNWNHYKNNNTLLESISIPKSDFETRNKFVEKIFDSFVERNNFYPIRPSKVLCDTFIKDRCVAQHNAVPFYFDDDHLSDVGAKLVVDKFIDEIGR